MTEPGIQLPDPWEWDLDSDGYWAARAPVRGGDGTTSVHEGAWPCNETLAITVRPAGLGRAVGHSAPVVVFAAVARANEELKGARSSPLGNKQPLGERAEILEASAKSLEHLASLYDLMGGGARLSRVDENLESLRDDAASARANAKALREFTKPEEQPVKKDDDHKKQLMAEFYVHGMTLREDPELLDLSIDRVVKQMRAENPEIVMKGLVAVRTFCDLLLVDLEASDELRAFISGKMKDLEKRLQQ